MRDHLLVYINGKRHEVRGADAFRTLSGLLRERLRLVGTKIVCEEGDCGACTVLVGSARGDRMGYRPVNSCILQMHQLDRTHVVTVEGVPRNGALSEVQERMVAHHGAQCGFCTPGFITAMTALFEQGDSLSEHDVRRGLTGNLCRCTGYEPIIKAALDVDPAGVQRMNDLYPPAEILADFARYAGDPVRIETEGRVFYGATDVAGAVRFKADHPTAVIGQGSTDVGVWVNKRAFAPEAVLNVTRIEGLDEIAVREGVLEVGATVTLWDLQEFVRDLIPQFHDILELFGAPQIRAAGTLAGNIANGSPIADTLPFLYVMDAELELTGLDREDGGWRMEDGGSAQPRAEGGERRAEGGGRRGFANSDANELTPQSPPLTAPSSRLTSRRLPIRDFYKGYKDFDLRPSEIITRTLFPLPAEGEVLRLYKVSKRFDLDISTFTAAFLMKRRGDAIGEMRVACGGVGPVVYRLPRTEAFLTGKPLTEDVFAEAGALAREEITPISDVRGSADYRYRLAETVLLKFYHEVTGEEVMA